MAVHSDSIEVSTKGHCDVVNITEQLVEAVRRAGAWDGIATVFVPGSTASVSTIEFEPGAVQDIGVVLEKLAPEAGPYHHHERHHESWGDDNGSSHARACLMGPSVTVPFVNGKLTLGTWQQVVLLDFDTQPRERKLVVLIIGE
jgi:secondary thiamine-phosphate synthase enzyme